jgi:hypothetical protein
MIFEAAARHGIDLAASYLVGDRFRKSSRQQPRAGVLNC